VPVVHHNFVSMKYAAFQNMIWRYCGSSTNNCNIIIMNLHRLTRIGCHLEMMKIESLIAVTVDYVLLMLFSFVVYCLFECVKGLLQSIIQSCHQ